MKQAQLTAQVETPDQAAELVFEAGERSELCLGTSGTRTAAAGAIHSRGPGFSKTAAERLHHGVVDFFELHARPAHPDESNEEGVSQFGACLRRSD